MSRDRTEAGPTITKRPLWFHPLVWGRASKPSLPLQHPLSLPPVRSSQYKSTILDPVWWESSSLCLFAMAGLSDANPPPPPHPTRLVFFFSLSSTGGKKILWNQCQLFTEMIITLQDDNGRTQLSAQSS